MADSIFRDIAPIGGIDILERGLRNAAALIEDGQLARVVRDGVAPRPRSDRQELLENLVSRFS